MKNVALITGASSGIGKELAYIHAATGGDLIIIARREEKLLAIKKEIEYKYPVQVEIIVKDLTKQEAARDIYNEVKQKDIEVNYLINNAGFGGRGFFHKREWEQDKAMIDLNIHTLTALTRFFLPDMIQKNKGKILNVASIAGMVPGPFQAVYFATKAFILSFSQGIAGEIMDTDVTITALCPGATATEFGKVAGMDKTKGFAKTASAKSVAKVGYDAMLKGKLVITAGLTFSQKITLCTVPFIPKKTMLKQVKQFQELI